MMTGAAAGHTRDELRDTAHRFGAMLRGETVDADQLGDLRALGGVSRFPARVPCALMAWRALDAALASG
jgi:nitrogen fixation NifU-like protein